MKKYVVKKICSLTIFIFIISAFSLNFPISCYAYDYELEIDVSPNIVNIASERVGSIRIFTAFRYATYVSYGCEVFVYFNDHSDPVENIHTTRDSLGNLILKFSLEDLLALEGPLYTEKDNDVKVVITMNEDEYNGESMLELVDKNGK